jgi:hypothetical protein
MRPPLTLKDPELVFDLPIGQALSKSGFPFGVSPDTDPGEGLTTNVTDPLTAAPTGSTFDRVATAGGESSHGE